MLRSDLEFVADAYARCLATTERQVPLDVSQYVPTKKYDFHWTLEKILPTEVIKEFQRRHLAIVCYSGGMCELPDPNATLHRPPMFTTKREDHFELDFLKPIVIEWKETLSNKHSELAHVRATFFPRRNKERDEALSNKQSEIDQICATFWVRIKDELWKHHRTIVRQMVHQHSISFDYDLYGFRDELRDEFLTMWITPFQSGTYEERLMGDPRAGHKSHMCRLMI